jgi:hypothetical protein
MASQLDETAHPARIGTRYHVNAFLGRGGMAAVYRVTDTATQRPLALKQLAVPDSAPQRQELVALFEREFLALTQLSHPRIIQVYDYGFDDTAPYYTMELLDGGDLRERSPLPWRDACVLLSGVCSSLALIHSRRLVHRDVSPGNIRCTHDGQAKLFDFGAMTSVGKALTVVGTPAFVAPEVVGGLALDGRTDLFSFGATLYFALTGHPPYPARSFSQLEALWKSTVPTPSSLVNGIPEALDALVMSLLCLEPAMRPRNAFEVMQRLAAIAGVELVEPITVSRAYLSSPTMVGRDEPMRVLRSLVNAAVAGRGRSVLVEGATGVGRSRLLDAGGIEAKMLGATVLVANAGRTRAEDFAVAQTLAEQLLERLPDPGLTSARSSGAFSVLFKEGIAAGPGADTRPRLTALAESGVPRLQLQTALAEWVLHVSGVHPLVIAIDDANEVDEPSAALLAVLASQARGHRLLVMVTAETGAPRRAVEALALLAGHSARIEVQPLTRAETGELLGSLFGDVQNLGPVSEAVYRLSLGNPRACLDSATHLVDKGVISYEGGAWTLPNRLDPRDLPNSAEDAIRASIARLEPLARGLAEAQALANDTFSREDYQLLSPDADPVSVDRAISELLSNQLLVADGGLYSLAHRGWASALTARMSRSDSERRHRALAVLYEHQLPIAFVRHLLAGGEVERSLDRLARLLASAGDASALSGGRQIATTDLATTIELALDAARAMHRPAREQHELRRWLMSLSAGAGDAFYWRAAPDWLAQLKRDSGLLDWQGLDDTDPGGRMARALEIAARRYAASPERERVYRPDEAIKMLCLYVLFSIAVASRNSDDELLESLPVLLEPLAPMLPVVETIRQNAIATCEARCRQQVEESRRRWKDVYERLGKMTAKEMPGVEITRNAVAFGIGSLEARMGLASAASWAELLERDPLQQVSALYLRKVVALQLGDSEGAERYQRRAEVLALQGRARQMFATTLHVELSAHALAGDLTGVKQVLARIRQLAAASPGWLPYVELGEAQFQELRGDLEAARRAFERCIAMARPDPSGKPWRIDAWAPAIAGYIASLVALERHAEARAGGEAALGTCRDLGIGVVVSHGISRALALAEAKLDCYAEAVARLEALIAEQQKIGVTGLILGASYEARARIAIWASDAPAIEKYSNLTATEYRHGRGSALGARWERLMAEARRASQRALPRPSDRESGSLAAGRRTSPTGSMAETVDAFLRDASAARERAERALKLLCDDRAAAIGYLYLVGDDGLTLVASQGSAAEPEGLQQYLQEYFDLEVSQNGDDTVALTDAQVASARVGRTSFRDRTDVEHFPIMMTSLTDGMSRHAGAAAFVGGARPERSAGGASLVGALSAHLIRAGDTRGVA